MSDRMDGIMPEEFVEHAGTHKTDSIATAQSMMPVHPDWLPCISSCKILPASRRQHAQKGMLQRGAKGKPWSTQESSCDCHALSGSQPGKQAGK